MSNCAECKNKPCEKGLTEGSLANCPSFTYSPEFILDLYSDADKKAAYIAALVEAEDYCKNTRLEETMDYAYKMGYKHLGVAFCVGFSEEAQILCKVLRNNGFIVNSVCCKVCCVSKKEIGISQEQQVDLQDSYEGMCNPIGQAYVLDEQDCELAIILGLCVGHDTLFMKHIKAPCTVLSAKDRVMGNNPIGAIYTANGYMIRQNSFIEKKYGKDAWEK